MQIEKIYEKMKELAPLELCESWDNSGFLLNMGLETERTLIALDATKEVVKEAKEKGCKLIITHHPVIFKGLKSIFESDVVAELIRSGISVISMHTNLDAADGGVNTTLAEILGLQDIEVFAGMGRKGILPVPMKVEELSKKVSEVLHANVKFSNGKKVVKRLALIGGSAGGYFREAKKDGCDCFLTGEASHHDGIDAAQADIGLIVAGHYSTEVIVLEKVKEYLEEAFPEEEFIISSAGKDPFSYIPEPSRSCQRCGMDTKYILEELTFNGKRVCLCPNCMAMAYLDGYLETFLEDDESLICDVTGKPGAIHFFSEGETYNLEKEIMLRLIARNLHSDEYKKLIEKYGPYKFLLHDDFYTENGEAIQPME